MIGLKCIFILLVYIISLTIGYLISNKYVQRVKELKEWQKVLNTLENKIKFTYEPLPEIFKQFEQITNGSIKKLFENININIKEKYPVQEAIGQALKGTNTMLKEEDKIIIEDFSKVLGRTDKEGQISQINLSKVFIESQIEKAETEEKKNSKLYKTLGAVFGLAFVIILI